MDNRKQHFPLLLNPRDVGTTFVGASVDQPSTSNTPQPESVPQPNFVDPERAFAWVIDKAGFAVLPAVGYYLAFRYEAGFCAAYGIPPSLIRPDLTTILIFTSAIVAFLPILMPLLDAFLGVATTPQSEHPVSRVIRLYQPLVIILVMILAVSGGNWRNFGFVFAIAGFLLLMDLVLARFHKDRKSVRFLLRMKGPWHSLGAAPEYKLTARWFGRYNVLILAVLIGAFIATLFGAANAHAQEIFLVPKNQPDAVVVRIYGEKAICAFVEPTEKKLTGRFYVTEILREKTSEFESKKIGAIAGTKSSK